MDPDPTFEGLTLKQVLEHTIDDYFELFLRNGSGLKDDDKFTASHFDEVRSHNEQWAEQLLYHLVRDSDLERAQKFELALLMDETYLFYRAITESEIFDKDDVFQLITGSDLEEEEMHLQAVINYLGFTVEQRVYLLDMISSDSLTYRAVKDCEYLPDEKKFKILDKIKNNFVRWAAANSVSGLTDDEREALRC